MTPSSHAQKSRSRWHTLRTLEQENTLRTLEQENTPRTLEQEHTLRTLEHDPRDLVPKRGDGARGHGERGVLGRLIVEELLFVVLAVRHGPGVC